MTGHKRILSIVYARRPILPIVSIVLHRIIEKGHLIAGIMAARVMKGGNHKGGARKIKGNGFWLSRPVWPKSIYIYIIIWHINKTNQFNQSFFCLFAGPDHSANYRGDGKNTPMKHDAKSLTDDMDRMQDLKSGSNRSPIVSLLLTLAVICSLTGGGYLEAWLT